VLTPQGWGIWMCRTNRVPHALIAKFWRQQNAF